MNKPINLDSLNAEVRNQESELPTETPFNKREIIILRLLFEGYTWQSICIECKVSMTFIVKTKHKLFLEYPGFKTCPVFTTSLPSNGSENLAVSIS